MRRVIIESPYAGDIEANTEYLKACVLDSLNRSESPYASHAFFPQFLDDDNPAERKIGIDAGLAWSIAAETVVYYVDKGMSAGMLYALERHCQRNADIDVRQLSDPGGPLKFHYTNWRGESSNRRAVFKRFYWGRTKYHQRDQVIMEAICKDRGEVRHFAVADMTLGIVAGA